MRLKINLLPEAERPVSERYRQGVLLAVLTCLLLLAGTYGYGVYREQALEERLAQAEQQYQLLRASELTMGVAQQKWTTLQARQQLLLTLTKQRTSWQAILAHLGVVAPKTVYLTEVNSGDGGVVSLKGTAADASQILTFAQKLERDELFAQPTILTVSQGDGAMDGAKFEILVKVKEL